MTIENRLAQQLKRMSDPNSADVFQVQQLVYYSPPNVRGKCATGALQKLSLVVDFTFLLVPMYFVHVEQYKQRAAIGGYRR